MGGFGGVFLVSVDITGDIFFISSDEIIQKTPRLRGFLHLTDIEVIQLSLD